MKKMISVKMEEKYINLLECAINEGRYKNKTEAIIDSVESCMTEKIGRKKEKILINKSIADLNTILTELSVQGYFPEIKQRLTEIRNNMKEIN